MKKLLVVLLGVALLYSCEKESDVLQDETNLELKDGGLSAEAEAENLYFGVFVSNDLELHGQIQVDLNEGAKHAAHVRLLNGKELYFKAATDLADDNIVHFKGTSGSFTIDFADASDMRATSFMVEGKEGHVKVYVQKTPGIPPPILFGFYEDLADPTFTGAFDVLNFGAVEPTVGLPLIEDIIITHIPNGTMYSDEDIGIIEPFVVPSCPGVPLPPIIAESGFTDGVIVAAIEQEATFNGDLFLYSLYGLAPAGFDPTTCGPLPPGIHGFWDGAGRTGVITILTPPWGPPPSIDE